MDFKVVIKKITVFILFFSLISVVFALTTDFSIENISKNLVMSLYEYADDESQNDVINKLNENLCGRNNLCNEDEIERLKISCNQYFELKNTINNFQQDFEVERLCNSIYDGSLEKSCAGLNIEEVEINKICSDHKNNMITNETFFIRSVLSIMPENEVLEKSWILKIHELLELVLIVLFFPLLILLFWLDEFKIRNYLRTLGNLSFSCGIVFFIGVILLKFYATFLELDTSVLVLGNFASFDVLSTEMKMLILFKLIPKTFNSMLDYKIIITGFGLLLIGLIFKIAFKRKDL